NQLYSFAKKETLQQAEEELEDAEATYRRLQARATDDSDDSSDSGNDIGSNRGSMDVYNLLSDREEIAELNAAYQRTLAAQAHLESVKAGLQVSEELIHIGKLTAEQREDAGDSLYERVDVWNIAIDQYTLASELFKKAAEAEEVNDVNSSQLWISLGKYCQSVAAFQNIPSEPTEAAEARAAGENLAKATDQLLTVLQEESEVTKEAKSFSLGLLEDIEGFNRVWNNTINKAEESWKAWHQLLEAWRKAETLKKDWNPGELDSIYYYFAQSELVPLRLKAEQSMRLADVVGNQALSVTANNRELFVTAWEKFLTESSAAETAWNQLLVAYLQGLNVLSSEHQKIWDQERLEVQNIISDLREKKEQMLRQQLRNGLNNFQADENVSNRVDESSQADLDQAAIANRTDGTSQTDLEQEAIPEFNQEVAPLEEAALIDLVPKKQDECKLKKAIAISRSPGTAFVLGALAGYFLTSFESIGSYWHNVTLSNPLTINPKPDQWSGESHLLSPGNQAANFHHAPWLIDADLGEFMHSSLPAGARWSSFNHTDQPDFCWNNQSNFIIEDFFKSDVPTNTILDQRESGHHALFYWENEHQSFSLNPAQVAIATQTLKNKIKKLGTEVRELGTEVSNTQNEIKRITDAINKRVITVTQQQVQPEITLAATPNPVVKNRANFSHLINVSGFANNTFEKFTTAAEEAKNAKHDKLSELWTKIASLFNKTVEYKTEFIQSYGNRSTEESQALNNAIISFQDASYNNAKSIQHTLSGKAALATGDEEAAKFLDDAANYYIQAV
ncbi:MAG: hypothetical protein ACH346_08435, partial [Chthoniobacterales bacterium]